VTLAQVPSDDRSYQRLHDRWAHSLGQFVENLSLNSE
jgi:hypothetical protein